MNSLSASVKSFLVVTNSTDYERKLYRLCLEKLKNGWMVVIITSEIYDFSSLFEQEFANSVDKDQMKNFIIMSYKTLDDISRKLLLLYSWSLMPNLVAVDLSQLIKAASSNLLTSASLMQKVTLCTVSLLVYLQSIAVQLNKSGNDNNELRTVRGLLILPSDADNFGHTQIQTLKDLYFYKKDQFQDFEAVQSLLLQETTGE